MCDDESILLDEGTISQSTYKPGEEFHVTLKVCLVCKDPFP